MIVSLPSRAELISWVNKIANTGIQKLEQMSDGILFCTIFERIYPRTINLNKLKRDIRSPLEKEKNFRFLLNAINQMGIRVTISIGDLSNGKITSILQLLQWIHRQFKNPSRIIQRGQPKESRVSEPRMIKSYVGNLVVRQKSCQKDENKSQNSEITRKSRKSLDHKSLLHSYNSFNQNDEIEEKNQVFSQKTLQNQSVKSDKEKKIKISINKQDFQRVCKEKVESIKKMKSERKKENLEESLHQALNFDRNKLHDTLIKITQAALYDNPALKQRLNSVILRQIQGSSAKDLSPDSQARHMLSSYVNSSQNCQIDTLEDKEVEKSQQLWKHVSQGRIPEIPEMSERQNNLMSSYIAKKQTSLDRKETVKKSSVKSGKSKVNNVHVLPQNVINQISAQKSRKNQVDEVDFPQKKQSLQPILTKDLNLRNNLMSQKPAYSNIFNPHTQVPDLPKPTVQIAEPRHKLINPEVSFTNTKENSIKQTEMAQLRRNAMSQNLSFQSTNISDEVWKKKPTQTQNPEWPF